MRKNLIYPLISAVILVSACNNSSQTTSQQHDHSTPQATGQSGSQQAPPVQQPTKTEPIAFMPDFKFYKVKSGFGFDKSDISVGKNTVFILFDPSCGHCQLETKALSQNYDKVKDINILYVSMNDPALMVSFLPTFGKELEGKPNVEVLYDRDQDFIRKFHIPDMFPANYVYGADGQLKSYWEGEKGIDEIIAEFTK